MKPIAVIGEGAWGTAIARVLADNGHQVNLWCCDPVVANGINNEHINTRYMPGFVLPKNIYAEAKLEAVLAGSSFVFISTPTAFFRNVLIQ
jgi:glycerol-3-phosphate dehydrogenase (NAD(P)+)